MFVYETTITDGSSVVPALAIVVDEKKQMPSSTPDVVVYKGADGKAVVKVGGTEYKDTTNA